MSHEGENDAVANVGVYVTAEPAGRTDGLGPVDVGKGDQDRVQDAMVPLVLQHAEKRIEAFFGKRAIREPQLPEDVYPQTALDHTRAPAKPCGSVQDLVSPPPVQGADGVPSEILVGLA